jgi:hypothetical protein
VANIRMDLEEVEWDGMGWDGMGWGGVVWCGLDCSGSG